MDSLPLPALLRHLADEDPDRFFLRPVLGAPERLGDAVAAVAGWSATLTEAEVGPGTAVATYLPAGPTAIHAWLAINGVGAIEVPIHLEYRGSYLAHVFRTSGVRVAIIAAEYLPRLREVLGELPDVETLIVLGEADLKGLPVRCIDAVSGAVADEWQPIEQGRHDPCTVLMTSGTTGPSKAVLVSHGQLRATAEGAWPAGTLDSRDRYYSVLPLFHVAAKQAVDAVLRSGGQLVIRERFSTNAFFEDVRATGATVTCLMGAMAGFLMNRPARPDDRDSPLAKVLMLPLPPSLDEFRERFGVRARTVYNQTEVSVPIASVDFDTPDPQSCGRLRDGYQCRIVDELDEDVSVGEVGELIVRADRPWTLMSGYIGAFEATAKSWRNLWLHTGDAFRVDADGNYFFVDRLDDVIRRRGENISSVELEASVCEHAEVAECAAVGVDSAWSEEEVRVFVVPREGAMVDPAELTAFLVARIPRFMVPRYVELIATLPKTQTGKVRKRELRELPVGDGTWDREATTEASVT
jgi:crotonobetaine/carnitine-CoA ligase